ncbi:hypothetical protein CKF54_07030 [Psittacicella hinzii]|uniref:Uncharacterized protein n=1 Tax=Psittacicella hinzii TaxID=2028575 RepID=A0A3A1Y554_9GAMM|nr:4'-phosphopantetheinyl transferase superfamily protein [Psittacicella hinzii]RIY31297.1 hypothetical protein CKF54_07030 [Psittacicella hinzii]
MVFPAADTVYLILGKVEQTQSKPENKKLIAVAKQQILQSLIDETKVLADVSTNSFGRPYFPQEYGMDFNFSHSSSWYALAFCRKERVKSQGQVQLGKLPLGGYLLGVDLEFPYKERKYRNLVASSGKNFQDVFSSQTFASSTYSKLLTSEQDKFYCLWCCREALVKAKGTGIADLNKIYQDPQTLNFSLEGLAAGVIEFYKLTFTLASSDNIGSNSGRSSLYLALYRSSLSKTELCFWQEKQEKLLKLEDYFPEVKVEKLSFVVEEAGL